MKDIPYNGDLSKDIYPSESETIIVKDLVQTVCEKFESGKFVGKTSDGKTCKCGTDNKGIVNSDGNTLENGACIISGNEKNNYLKYDGVMFRVLGVYDLGDGTLSAKMITDQTVEIN